MAHISAIPLQTISTHDASAVIRAVARQFDDRRQSLRADQRHWRNETKTRALDIYDLVTCRKRKIDNNEDLCFLFLAIMFWQPFFGLLSCPEFLWS